MTEQQNLQLRMDIDADLAAQVTVAAIAHGTSVSEEVSAALHEWLGPLPAEPEPGPEGEATILTFEPKQP